MAEFKDSGDGSHHIPAQRFFLLLQLLDQGLDLIFVFGQLHHRMFQVWNHGMHLIKNRIHIGVPGFLTELAHHVLDLMFNIDEFFIFGEHVGDDPLTHFANTVPLPLPFQPLRRLITLMATRS